jgi:hypothetical protein
LTAAALALCGLVQAGVPSDKDAGLLASREGRYEDALPLLERAVAREADYESLVALAVARGRTGALDAAGEALDRALGLAPSRPEAWIERGGLRFVQSRYLEAARDLERALRLGDDDAYARELLASSLHLAGRPDDALRHWNALGQPRLGALEIKGLEHTRDAVARRELPFREGELLRRDDVREARLRLGELGIFDRITLRTLPKGDGTADLEVALAERHGLFRSPVELAVSSGVNALQRRVRLRYWNLGGSGLSFAGQYRWESNRPAVALSIDWPRPLGAPVNIRVTGFRERQLYDLETDFTRRSRGASLVARRVLGAATVGELGWHARSRTFAPSIVEDGRVAFLSAALERRLVESGSGRLDAALRVSAAGRSLGSDLGFGRFHAVVGGHRLLAPPEGKPIEASVLAARVQYGWASGGVPLDERFAPGASPDMELPLRARHQARHGALGATPLGRSLAIANLEWRLRVADRSLFQAGVVILYDAGRLGSATTGREEHFHDVGAGLRARVGLSTVVRIDFAHGLVDGKNALSFGLGQVF